MENSENRDLAIYVSSYDGCSDIWDIFFTLFERYWKDCDYPIYLINNERDYIRDKVQCIHTGKEINWFYRTRKSLSVIREEYVFFLLEDYFLSKEIDNYEIERILNYMHQHEIGFYQMWCREKRKAENVISTLKNCSYPVSLQPAIWNRKKLLNLIDSYDGKSPWDFEMLAMKQFYNVREEQDKLGIAYDTRDLMGYHNGVLRGKWIPMTIDFYRKQGIMIECGKRPVLEKKVLIKYKIASWVSSHFSRNLKEKVKAILSRYNIKYVE